MLEVQQKVWWKYVDRDCTTLQSMTVLVTYF